MALFGKKEICCICGIEEGIKKISDGKVCRNCLRNTGILYRSLSAQTKNSIIDAIDYNNRLLALQQQFHVSKQVGKYIEFDDMLKLWRIPYISLHDENGNTWSGSDKLRETEDTLKYRTYSFHDVIGFELLEDGVSITSRGIGKSRVGGALFGSVGAIVGGNTAKRKTKMIVSSLKVKITINDIRNPVIYIELINTPIKSDSLPFKQAYGYAQEILSVFSLINHVSQEIVSGSERTSVADEIIKLKSLVDVGVLTQEEFDKEKEKLLQ